ncbi:MAG TPA: hypothetical protein VFP10_06785 [Candidatus Eisenbacteria bacterium]|nr:hypothetical protein [Candidatus Eisenbacteria bacterium]
MKRPTSVEIRGYQVGFGDCFLLSFVYGTDDRRHVLIDFGSTGLPRRGNKVVKPAVYMPQVARQIATDCGGRLTALVATHRHADHINGFSTEGAHGGPGAIIRQLKPKLVIQPWTEDPDAARNAHKATRDSSRSTRSFIRGLDAMHRIAEAIARVARAKAPGMSFAAAGQLNFLGQENIGNRSAVENLIAMGKAKGSRAAWVHHGSKSGLERLLPGVRVHVLGPPNLTQTEKIRTMRRTDPDEFWHLLGSQASVRAMEGRMDRIHRRSKATAPPIEARWFVNRLDHLRTEQLLQIVRILDDQMNNTSVILLIEVFGKRLLFPGDAQIENWSYALQDAPTAEATRTLLQSVDVYKVGHHGSLNATPRKLLWEHFANRNRTGNKRLRTLLSTMAGKHGRTQNKTEVPRRTLLKALEAETSLETTADLKMSDSNHSFLTVVKP